MEKLDFYFVDKDYVNYLKQAEIEKRGFSRVPNVEYSEGRKPKFLCGIVLQVNGVDYYAPLSSYKIQKPDNFLIHADNGQVISSLRFNYMFPIPRELTTVREISSEPDRAYRSLLSQELQYCIKNQDTIQKSAERTYKRVLLGKDSGLVVNSCDFLLLEEKCKEYAAGLEKMAVAEPEQAHKVLTPEEQLAECEEQLEAAKASGDKQSIGKCIAQMVALKKEHSLFGSGQKKERGIDLDEPEL